MMSESPSAYVYMYICMYIFIYNIGVGDHFQVLRVSEGIGVGDHFQVLRVSEGMLSELYQNVSNLYQKCVTHVQTCIKI